VLTTHGMDEAEQLCDRVGIIDRGQLVACGTTAELTAGLGLAAERVLEARPGQYVVRSEATPSLVATLTAWLRDHDVALGELRAGRRSLEEVFLRLTGDGHE
jgi:ABC-2 type transport system ATP-binding protein